MNLNEYLVLLGIILIAIMVFILFFYVFGIKKTSTRLIWKSKINKKAISLMSKDGEKLKEEIPVKSIKLYLVKKYRYNGHVDFEYVFSIKYRKRKNKVKRYEMLSNL